MLEKGRKAAAPAQGPKTKAKKRGRGSSNHRGGRENGIASDGKLVVFLAGGGEALGRERTVSGRKSKNGPAAGPKRNCVKIFVPKASGAKSGRAVKRFWFR